MDDVARRAGVSKITVSRALRGHHSVSPETLEKIQSVVRELGYVKNPLVDALMTQVRRRRLKNDGVVIGVLNPLGRVLATHESMRIRNLWEGMALQAEQSGYRLEEFDIGPGKLTGERCNKIMLARGIRGVMVMYFSDADARLQIQWDRFCCATVGYSLREPQLHRVVPDQYHNALLLASELQRQGRRRPSLVVNLNSAIRTDHLWEAGLSRWCREVRKGKNLPVFMEENLYSAGTRKKLKAWICTLRPDVVISNHDFLQDFVSENWTGGGDVPAFAHLDLVPGGTAVGIDQNFFAVGAAVIDLIIGQLMRNESGIPLIPKTVLIPGRLVLGS